ncbi:MULTISPECIES: MGMT family protein [unclassified Rhodococcus (in: high G+C Gram-positive bacteria)]|jgi:alkylated DNA nucleotide flippase Atl1|uniref:MGMT family protein n=1 Tax=unclassified Rhodococcus (in: high G+C Gram-positive bacteria) TaxID=192944 RepID=UPI00146AED7E|nr:MULTISPECIES: MGMT family protein [unclassified Rhodococcus (in: high G+C Gram-positive bacteria)]NMD94403.1 DNA methyltransferase [Rhodococcus sp. BL-253-APC-6A1W]NME78442.1 DNA methyltransferase [Rhodococcus sp. 105337]
MAATTDDQIEKVRALVASIPEGRVATYGDIADAAELSSPRTVGWIMRTDTADLPWHRVVPASGRPAAHLAYRQLARLALEGTPIRGDRVDLAQARHLFPAP